MLFTLIKNEFIKLFRKAKTWIVFALFALCVIAMAVMSNINAKDMRYNMSPEGRIESLNQSMKWQNEHLKSIENLTEPWVKEEITRIKEEISNTEQQIKEQEDRKNKPVDAEAWKKDLEEEKKLVQQNLADENVPDMYKNHDKQRLEQINAYLEAGIEPVPEWEFDAANYSKGFMQMIGLIILVAGIAVFMSDIVSGEATPPTLKFLLVQPISRGKVLLSKFITVVLTVVGMISGLQLAAFGVVGAIGGFDGMKMPTIIGNQYKVELKDGYPELTMIDGSGILATRGEALFQSFALQILFIVACCAIVFLISAIIKSSMITMAISVIISVASTMICMMSSTIGSKFAHLIFLNYGNTPSIIDGSVAYMFNNPNFTMGLGVVLMVGTTIVSYLIAHIVFSKKDILI